MKMQVKECCVSPNGTSRFEADEGDVVLLRNGGSTYFEATVHSVLTVDTIVVTYMIGADEIVKEVPATDVKALLLGD